MNIETASGMDYAKQERENAKEYSRLQHRTSPLPEGKVGRCKVISKNPSPSLSRVPATRKVKLSVRHEDS